MDDKTFKSIIATAGAIRLKSEELQNKYDKTPDLNSWSINEFNSAIELAKDLQSKMDLWIRNDLYHIIGMAHLSAKQMAMLMKETNAMLKHRSTVKNIATLQTCPIYCHQVITEVEKYSLATNHAVSIQYPVTKIKMQVTKEKEK